MLRRHYDVIEVCNPPDMLILAALMAKLLGAKVLYDAHDGVPESLGIQKGLIASHPIVRLSTWLEKLAFSIADEAITVHEVMRKRFIQRGAKPQWLSVVMNVPDHKRFEFPSELVERINGHFTLIYTGTVSRPYGLQTAIRALPLLQDIKGLKLRIIGPGNYKKELSTLAEECGVANCVSLEPPVTHQEVIQIFQTADVGISPHTGGVFGEICFSNKVTEYMAAGLPVVVSRTPVYEYYFDSSQLAFCNPDDPHSFAEQVRAIYRDPEYGRQLSANGLKRVQVLNWDHERMRYLEVVARLASRG